MSEYLQIIFKKHVIRYENTCSLKSLDFVLINVN